MSDGLTEMFREQMTNPLLNAARPGAFNVADHPDARNYIGSTQQRIIEVCDRIKDMLLTKNRKYGDSALNPVRVFAKSDNLEQIRVRIDDKLNRLKNQQQDEDEDVVDDLIGYLVLYKIAKERS